MLTIVSKEGTVDLCKCRFRIEEINKVLKIPKRYWKAELENFDTNGSLANAYKEVYLFVRDFPSLAKKGKGLIFIGPPGVGKTYLAIGILKEIYKRHGIKGAFFDTKDLIYRLKYLIESNKNIEKLYKKFSSIHLLFWTILEAKGYPTGRESYCPT